MISFLKVLKSVLEQKIIWCKRQISILNDKNSQFYEDMVRYQLDKFDEEYNIFNTVEKKLKDSINRSYKWRENDF